MVDAADHDDEFFGSIQVLRDEDKEFLDAIDKMASFAVGFSPALLLCKL